MVFLHRVWIADEVCQEELADGEVGLVFLENGVGVGLSERVLVRGGAGGVGGGGIVLLFDLAHALHVCPKVGS